MTDVADDLALFDPQRWGLPAEAVMDLANRLQRIWERYHDCFTTKTRDTSPYGFSYLRGLLTMETDRNYANIARRVIAPDDDGQNLQQFMSDSPWSSAAVFQRIQAEIRARPDLHGGMLTLDESADERAGDQSAGAARQYLGRFGKVDLGQVGVALGYTHAGIWTLVDAELYLPQVWFDPAHADLQRRWHIPSDRTFATKPELGLRLIRRAKANALPFDVVGCDSLYGRDSQFRADLDAEKVLYVADIPVDTLVYLTPPQVGVPTTPRGKRGRPATRPQVLTQAPPLEVRMLVTRPEAPWQTVAIRQTERGLLTYACAARRVWTLTPDRRVREEWLVLRQEHDRTFSFALSNAPATTPLVQLAEWRCQRYFGERTFQDAKSEAGWDELVARKYRAWMHHTALDALALWFVAETKLDWAQAYPRDPTLVQQLEVAVLPALSMANVREMLQAVLPLPQLSPEQATHVVIKHLVHRSRSTRSRLKQQRRKHGAT
jgi:SRSO17 transposase